jgi:hypothetical protein
MQQSESVDLRYLAEHMDEFEGENVIVTGTVRYHIQGEITVGFYDNVSKEEANALIESYHLTWEPDIYWENLKCGVVKVPIGQELQWIETFENENIVKWAELVYIFWLPESPGFMLDNVWVRYPMEIKGPPENSIVIVKGKVIRGVIVAYSWTVISE